MKGLFLNSIKLRFIIPFSTSFPFIDHFLSPLTFLDPYLPPFPLPRSFHTSKSLHPIFSYTLPLPQCIPIPFSLPSLPSRYPKSLISTLPLIESTPLSSTGKALANDPVQLLSKSYPSRHPLPSIFSVLPPRTNDLLPP